MGYEGAVGLDVRRVGIYGHYVQALSLLAEDLEDFLDLPLKPYLPEVLAISRDDQGVHPEEAALLYLLVRACKPKLMLETGTFKGYSTAEIARALRENRAGHVLTVDVSPETGGAVPEDLLPYITFYRGEPSYVFACRLQQQEATLNIFFHDSLHTYANTLTELTCFSEHYGEGCVIVCHDAKMDYVDGFGVGKAVRRFAECAGIDYRVLDTTCGLAVMRWTRRAPVTAMEVLRKECADLERSARRSLLKRVCHKLKALI